MSKSRFSKICLAGALLGAAVQGRALTFTYSDMISYIGQPKLGSGAGGSVTSRSGVFNILPGGSGGDVITVTTATGGGATKYFDAGQQYIDKDGFQVGKESVVDPTYISFYFRDNNDASVESYTVSLDGGYTSPGTVVNRSVKFEQIGGNADIFAEIDADGKLAFTISRVSGDFYFDYARLDVTTVPTPDGGTSALLLGLGFVGTIALRGRMSR